MSSAISRRNFVQMAAVGVASPRLVGVANATDALAAVRQQAIGFVEDGQAPSLSVAVFRHGHPSWIEAFGFANRADGVRANPNTRYAIASASKPFTGTAVARLVASGAFALDAPIERYLLRSEIADQGNPVTLREALQHRSGIPKHWRNFFQQGDLPPPFWTVAEDHAFTTSAKGRRYLYSNMNYGLLAEAVEHGGERFHRHLRRTIFEPLGLKSAGFLREHFEVWNAAVPYENDGTPIPPYLVDEVGARDLVMTATDLARFGLAHLEGRFGAASRIMVEERSAIGANGLAKSSYGLGWIIEEDSPAALFSYGHTGEGPGGASSLTIVPSERLVVVTVANAQGAPAYALNEAIVDALSPRFAERRRANPFQEPAPDKRALESLSGNWRGELRLPGGVYPVAISLGPAPTSTISLAGKTSIALTDGVVRSDLFSARVAAELPVGVTPRLPHDLRLSLFRVGDELDGSMGAFAQRGINPHDQFWINYPLRLRRF